MGPRAGLDKCGKSRRSPGFDPRTVQPVDSRYTDYATRPKKLYKAVVILILLYGCETCIKKSGIVEKENEIIKKKMSKVVPD